MAPLDLAPISILYQQDDLLVVNKPAGLLVHRSEIDRHESDFLLQRVRDQIDQHVYAVNRLDKPTSGLVVMTTCRAAVAPMAEAMQAQSCEKKYLAVLRGVLPSEGHYDKALKRIQDDCDKRQGPNQAALQEARTSYTRLAQCELPVRVDRYPTSRYSLTELTLHTGRRHQLRRHMKSLSHPIIGDTSYGKSRHNRLFSERYGCSRLLLHAWKLAFVHPATGQSLRFLAPLDPNFDALIKALGWEEALMNAVDGWRSSTVPEKMPEQ